MNERTNERKNEKTKELNKAYALNFANNFIQGPAIYVLFKFCFKVMCLQDNKVEL